MTLQELSVFYRQKLGPTAISRICGVDASHARGWGAGVDVRSSQKMPIAALDALIAAHPEIAAEAGVAYTAGVSSNNVPKASNSATYSQTVVEIVPPPPLRGIPDEPLPPAPTKIDPLPADARCMILMASNRPIHPLTEYCLRSLIEASEGKVVFGEPEAIYDIFMARNRLADRFLQSELPWSLWLDSDTVLPCAKPEFYRRHVPAARRWENPMHAAMNAIAKLASNHQEDKSRKIIAATYYDRFGRGIPMFESAKSNPDFTQSLNNAPPRWETVDAGAWAGTGALLVHRDVYLRIMETQPEYAVDRAKYPHEQHGYGFFDKLNHAGDDVSFCQRAKKAGFSISVDMSVVAAHIGDYGYTGEVIAGV